MKLETGSAYRPVVGLSTNGPPACKWIDAGQWRKADPRYILPSRIVQSGDAGIVL